MPLQSGSDTGPAGDAAGLPRGRSTWPSSTGSGRPCPRRRSRPTSSSGSPARPRATSATPSTSCEQARFASAFTFQYSIRPGTPAADAARPGAARGGRRALRAAGRPGVRGVLAGEPEARRAARSRCWSPTGRAARTSATHRMSGRAARQPAGALRARPSGDAPRPGDIVTTVVTRAAPHHLVADGDPLAVRRTRGGDAWAARQAAPAAPGTGGPPGCCSACRASGGGLGARALAAARCPVIQTDPVIQADPVMPHASCRGGRSRSSGRPPPASPRCRHRAWPRRSAAR